ncbi:MAG TPA: hypothetical protein VEX43_16795 [Chthoniobacterales bacterium]|nr:hypothetical protein [Chthoniobacterales bacterium]
MPKPIVLQDACVLLNLLATGCFEQLCGALDFEFVIARAAAEEALFLRDASTNENVVLDLTELVEKQLLSIVDVETDEERQRYIAYATELDDGEAMSLALAECRHIALATDDRKAIRLITEQKLPIDIWSTVGLLQEWQKKRSITKNEMRQILVAIRDRARFVPKRPPEDAAWWNSFAQD